MRSGTGKTNDLSARACNSRIPSKKNKKPEQTDRGAGDAVAKTLVESDYEAPARLMSCNQVSTAS